GGEPADGVPSGSDPGYDIFLLQCGPPGRLARRRPKSQQSDANESHACLIGIARPIPSASLAFAEATPTTCFWALTTGPPELRGLMGAENWMNVLPPSPGKSSRTALTTPVVTLCARPSGAPTTTIGTPDFTWASAGVSRLKVWSECSRARSLVLSTWVIDTG